MLAAAIIVSREVLEASLVVGIVLAATKGIVGRGLWVCGGIVGGLALAGVVAAGAEVIAAAIAGIGQELPVDHVEASRLAGAVGADQRQELAFAHVEADAVDGAHAAERFSQRMDREHAHGEARLLARNLAIVPTMPPGNTKTSSRMTAPSSARQYSVCRMIVS